MKKVLKNSDRSRDLILRVVSHFWDLYDLGLIDKARLVAILANL